MTERTIGQITYHVHTNRQPRALVSYHDLPESAREDFDYITGDDRDALRLVAYRGEWYDTYEFERTGDDVRALGFDGVQGDSYWSATVIAYFDRAGDEFDDAVVVGRIHW